LVGVVARRAVRLFTHGTNRAELEAAWWKKFGSTPGAVPPSLRMPLAEAMALPGVPGDYTTADVLAAFRRNAKEAHPDAGGTAEMFRRLVEARDRLLSAIGTSAPPPKPPQYAPRGARIRPPRAARPTI
jgi:hypothetical protein